MTPQMPHTIAWKNFTYISFATGGNCVELAHLPVALPALDVAREVLAVGEAEVGRGHHDRRHLPALPCVRAHVAERALPGDLLAGAHVRRVGVVDAVVHDADSR